MGGCVFVFICKEPILKFRDAHLLMTVLYCKFCGYCSMEVQIRQEENAKFCGFSLIHV